MEDQIEGIKVLNLKRVLDEFCEEYVKRLKEKLLANGHKATGNLIDSLRTEIVTTSSAIKVVLISEGYLKYVDYGRPKGGKPPYQAIRDWVDAKHLNPTGDTFNRLPTEKKLDSLAYAIRESIGKLGTMEKYGYGGHGGAYSDKVLEELLPKYGPRFEEALQKDFEIQAKAEIDDLMGAIRL